MEERPEIKIRGGRQTRKEKKERSKLSCFLLTVSTNQRYREDDKFKESDAEILEDIVKDILSDLPAYITIKKEGDVWNKETIESVDIDYACEFGPKTEALHAHMLIKIKHRSKVQLNLQKIKQKIIDELGVKNIYMFNRMVRPSHEDWLVDYLDKMK